MFLSSQWLPCHACLPSGMHGAAPQQKGRCHDGGCAGFMRDSMVLPACQLQEVPRDSMASRTQHCHLVCRTCMPKPAHSHALPAGVPLESTLCRQVVDQRLMGVCPADASARGGGSWPQWLWLPAVQEGSQGAAEHAGSEHPDQGLDQGGEARGTEGALWQGERLHQGAGHRGAESVCLHGGLHVPLAAK